MKTVLNLTRATSKYFKDDIFDDFVKEVEKLPSSLTKEQETELFKKIEKGDIEARNTLWEANQRFVVKTAKLYANIDNINDLIEEGNLGLFTAIEKFDWRTGNKFISLAVWYIRRAIVTYLLHDSQPVKKSNNAKTALKVRKIRERFWQENQRYPELDEIQDILKTEYNVTIKDKADLLDITYDSINMNVDTEEDGYTFGESSYFNEKTASTNEYEIEVEKDYKKMIADKLLGSFKERERTIIEMSFGLGKYEGKEMKPAEIAEEVGLTGERVRQLKNEALKRMRKLYTQYVNEVA